MGSQPYMQCVKEADIPKGICNGVGDGALAELCNFPEGSFRVSFLRACIFVIISVLGRHLAKAVSPECRRPATDVPSHIRPSKLPHQIPRQVGAASPIIAILSIGIP